MHNFAITDDLDALALLKYTIADTTTSNLLDPFPAKMDVEDLGNLGLSGDFPLIYGGKKVTDAFLNLVHDLVDDWGGVDWHAILSRGGLYWARHRDREGYNHGCCGNMNQSIHS